MSDWRTSLRHWTQRSWPAGKALALLGALFGLAFVAQIVWLASDQRQVLASSARLLNNTVPSTLEQFRLARNIEQLRLDGERVFSGRTPVARQQALFIVSLLSSHPAMLADRRTATLASEVESFLVRAAREGMTEQRYAEWETLSNRLSLLADDFSIEGANLATDDLQLMSATMLRSQFKLALVLALVAVFVGGFLFLIHRHLIRPLQKMDEALCELRSGHALTPFSSASMTEIRALEGAIGQLRDVMHENQQARQELHVQATTDSLTGMFNRRHFMALAEDELKRAHRYARPICVGMADMDHFKDINDRHGHAVGDRVLKSIAELFGHTLRQSDWVCRYGGEEFAFLFTETTLEEAHRLAERLCQRTADNCIDLGEDNSLPVTLSLGLADASGGSLEAALKRADAALYQAKKQGRNRVVIAGEATTTPPEAAHENGDDLEPADERWLI
ncbi:GGDEF domain-containing protein [Candidatus Accumulibacter phosphatis]|uniref:diguanylate cyclase n=1 Tax=Candidatus Accumulibacter phosphatis TaxID=327160 RepID=A0ABX1TWS4_9PROT|nr:GGDEF domain-containing protein [Candidatus Accumulibacter phosphatis]NMQ27123.1 GGDEF domain-containing protein [Candidatus Accumulibacter phosphatis]